MDAITLLKEDHKKVKSLFRDFERCTDPHVKRELVDDMIKELCVHAALEEQIFYPAARETLADDSIVLEGMEEHHVVKWTLNELDGMSPDAERFDAKVKVLTESVRHHIKEEEEQMFPKIRQAMGRRRLQEIGEALAEAKPLAPTRPHPRLPDEPPANVIAGVAMGTTDKVVDLASGAIRRVVDRESSDK